MGSKNLVILIGRLGKDPEVKRTTSGKPVASFSIATGEKYTDKSGQKQETTDWHNIVAWDKLADLASQYLKKGSLIYLEGRLKTRSWDTPAGEKRYSTEVIANNIQFLDSKSDNQQQGYNQSPQAPSYNQAPQQQQAQQFQQPQQGYNQAPQQHQQHQQQYNNQPPPQEPILDDVLPF